jgi:membrane fusion protein
MQLLDTIRAYVGRLRPVSQPKTPSIMSRFEVTGLHELGSSIEFRRDTASSLMTLFFSALAVFIIIGLWVGTFSKQETMRGVVMGSSGSLRMTTTVPGIATKIWVKQGDTVKAGQKLLTITPQQTSGGAASLSQGDVESLEVQKLNTQKQIDELQQLLARDDNDLLQFDSDSQALRTTLVEQISSLEKAVADQSQTVEKLQHYLTIGYATRESLSAQQRTRLDYLRQLADTRIQLAQLNTSRLERHRTVEQSRSSNTNQLSQLMGNLQDFDARIERAKSYVATDILASADGKIAALNVREGSEVAAGDTVAAIGDPDAPFTIGLQAPSKAIGLVAVGQRVVLKYDAFPFKTFGVKYGKITSIGEQPLVLPKVLDTTSMVDPRRPPQSNFLIEVQPEDTKILAYGVERPILIGSTLTADVVVERRRLIDWVLDPILAMKGRL